MKNLVTGLSASLPPGVYRALIIRLVFFTVFASSVGLGWWSVHRLPPLDKKLEQQNMKVAALENEIQQLELNPDPVEADRMATKFKEAQELVFAGPDDAFNWPELRRAPDRFVVKAETQVGRTQACPMSSKKFPIISATLDLQPAADHRSTNSPYRELLDFAQYLTTQKKRADLTELTVRGSSNSVSTAKVGLQLWAQENAP